MMLSQTTTRPSRLTQIMLRPTSTEVTIIASYPQARLAKSPRTSARLIQTTPRPYGLTQIMLKPTSTEVSFPPK